MLEESEEGKKELLEELTERAMGLTAGSEERKEAWARLCGEQGLHPARPGRGKDAASSAELWKVTESSNPGAP